MDAKTKGREEGRKEASKQKTGDGEIVAIKGSAVIASHPSRPPPTQSTFSGCASEIFPAKYHNL